MIRFTYKLGGVGWASATLTDGQSDVTFPASYLCDALRDLVDGVQSLFVTDNAQVRWDEEPGAVLWDFRGSDSRLIVKVRWHDDRESFEGDEDWLHFGSEVDRQLDDLLASWGADGYRKQRRYSFPQEAHNKLKPGTQSRTGTAQSHNMIDLRGCLTARPCKPFHPSSQNPLSARP